MTLVRDILATWKQGEYIPYETFAKHFLMHAFGAFAMREALVLYAPFERDLATIITLAFWIVVEWLQYELLVNKKVSKAIENPETYPDLVYGIDRGWRAKRDFGRDCFFDGWQYAFVVPTYPIPAHGEDWWIGMVVFGVVWFVGYFYLLLKWVKR